ncbi:endoglucanase Y [Nostoc commune NIES-4072]|uniref:Endoglucanase Y n=1 Tax=Nostoc commune NIES-4072 TaxID=2005467 RepID=A0A2R5G1H6_NOSCO|nr:glycosyl hydrolase family 8 [Nostoc commune]BBD67085.1 endoglucanase Y [Nostoc commune HK-02]GBG21931.1 endoglucanase Y [Nostoc commune NIES-4072]
MWHFPKVAAIACLIGLSACVSSYSAANPKTPDEQTPVANVPTEGSSQNPTGLLADLPESTPNRELLAQSWDSYRQRFIQSDGRVIDYEASDRSTSEGQAYALLRAVLINDPTTFALTLNWSENNLQRQVGGKRTDSLWAWKWGRKEDGNWGVIDSNFASDGDIDAITALILASRRWHQPEYLKLAKLKLQDLWNLSTISKTQGKRYLLPGPVAAFVPNASTVYLNPSYFAPYAFRIFAQVDPQHDWLSLVDSSYQVLEDSAKLSSVGLPSDWVALNTKTGQYQTLPASSTLKSLYSFDSYRVWWRLSLDAAWFNSPQAQRYLVTSTQHLQKLWSKQSIPARIDLQGKPLVDYEATSQYAMLYAAMQVVKPAIAQELLVKKILPQYKQGIWGDQSAYYTQNLAWLGLLPPKTIPQRLLK